MSRHDPPDRVGPSEILAPRPKRVLETRNVVQIRALSVLFRAKVWLIELRPAMEDPIRRQCKRGGPPESVLIGPSVFVACCRGPGLPAVPTTPHWIAPFRG